MDKNAWWKWLLLLALTCFSLYLVIPPKDKIRLGLDLAGGLSFTLQVDEEAARREAANRNRGKSQEIIDADAKKMLENAPDRAVEIIRNRIDGLGIAEPQVYKGKGNRIIVQLPGIPEELYGVAESNLMSVAFMEFRMVHAKNDELVEELGSKNLAPQGYLLQRNNNEYVYIRDPQVPEKDMTTELRKQLSDFHAPPGHEFMLEKEERDGAVFFRPNFVEIKRRLKGDMLRSAAVDFNMMNGKPVVNLKFDAKGSKIFKDVTTKYSPGGTENPGLNSFRKLAIVMDNTLYSAPVLKEPIPSGSAEISGQFTTAEAHLLANVLNAGALPAPLTIIEKKKVSPSLGQEAINSGVTAILMGAGAVLLFMLVYYRFCGMVANIALFFNVILLPLGAAATAGFLGIFTGGGMGGGGQASGIQLPVLTLPGLAGIALTAGMAVDANVLIYERIREELNAGKKLWAAIAAGYDRAFLAIIDSNITTLLAGVILFLLGMGPIRGFAVMLCAGIFTTLFTALTVTRLIFGLSLEKGKLSKISMMRFMEKTSINFLGKRHVAITCSVVLILASWAYMAGREWKHPNSIYGIDFTGGSSVTMSYKEQVDTEKIRGTLETAGLREVNVQYQKELDGSGEMLQISTGEEKVNGTSALTVITNSIVTAYPDAGFQEKGNDMIGAQVGKELKQKATWAVIAGLIGIVIYVAIRFEFGFSLGVLVSLAHDVLITIGVFALFDRQFSLTFIAALLTIAGFSANDTIVIFDRIRENLKLVRNKTFTEICNQSINETLSRTLITNLTAFMTVVMLLIFGGGAIQDLALALFIGMLAGTYSTIFIATPVVLWWHKGEKPVMAVAVVK